MATVTTRLAIDELRSACPGRDRDVGGWLPGPIITDSHDDPADRLNSRLAVTSDAGTAGEPLAWVGRHPKVPAAGRSNQRIAHDLVVALDTVKMT